MRIRLFGTVEEVNLATEVLCVLGTVGGTMSTFPSSELPGYVTRHLTASLDEEVLTDLQVTRTPTIKS